MKSALPGTPTSGADVTNVSPQGLWILLDGEELFLAFVDFPWFEQATIGELTRVVRPSPHHLYWPALDVDLAVDSLRHPSKYPLVSQALSNERMQSAGRHSGGQLNRSTLGVEPQTDSTY